MGRADFGGNAGESMIEVEVKLPLPSLNGVEGALLNIGFVFKESFLQEDRYYDTAEGFVRVSGQALRLRKIISLSYEGEMLSEHTLITFKGKKLDLVSMTRKELETEVVDFTTMDEILNELGFSAVQPVVKKIRKEYVLGEAGTTVEAGTTAGAGTTVGAGITAGAGSTVEAGSSTEADSTAFEMHACMDLVEGLGAYLELEIMAEEEGREEALLSIERMLERLGFSVQDTTTNSYLSMLQGVED